MTQDSLMKALVQAKRMNNLFNEVLDLSRQMAEAIDRSDPVSVEMLMAMRQEPIEKLEATEQAMWDLVGDISDPDQAARLDGLIRGAPAQSPEEQPLADQVAANRRRLNQVLELDKAVSWKLTRDKSIYR